MLVYINFSGIKGSVDTVYLNEPSDSKDKVSVIAEIPIALLNFSLQPFQRHFFFLPTKFCEKF